MEAFVDVDARVDIEAGRIERRVRENRRQEGKKTIKGKTGSVRRTPCISTKLFSDFLISCRISHPSTTSDSTSPLPPSEISPVEHFSIAYLPYYLPLVLASFCFALCVVVVFFFPIDGIDGEG